MVTSTRGRKDMDPEALAAIAEIQQMNKKRLHEARKAQEEDELAGKEASETNEDEEMDGAEEGNGATGSGEIHNIMGGTIGAEDDGETRSPLPKRGGSSKSSSRRTNNKVSPPEATGATPSTKTAKFLEHYVHPYSRVILDLAITLKKEEAFQEFTTALMDLLTNAQMVDPRFVINPLQAGSKEKYISSRGKISSNMTKLGCHVRISGNGNVFNRQKVWNNEDKPGRKKKETFKDPTVWFTIVVSSSVPPVEIIQRITHEWARIGGMRIAVKDLQNLDSETVVSIFKVSTATDKKVILAELKRILSNAQAIAEIKGMDHLDKYDFSMEMDVAIGESLPEMNLRVQNAKLRGQDMAIFNKLSGKAQYARKSWHLEVASKHAKKMKALVQYAKEQGCVEQLWGRHAHLSEVTDINSSAHEAKRQVDVAQAHTNYQVSMGSEELLGAINVDETADVFHPTKGKVATYSLRYILLNYMRMKDQVPFIAEVHQASLAETTHLVIPLTSEAERLMGMMNKNLPAFLWHNLLEQGFPEDFITKLIQGTCDAALVAEMHQCKWDSNSQTLTTPEEDKKKDITKAFESASWFRDEFGLLNQTAKNASKYVAPQAVFDLDGETVKTIHDRHRIKEGQEPPSTPPRHSKAGTVKKKNIEKIDLVDSDDSGDSSAEADDDSQGDSASSTGSSVSQSGITPRDNSGRMGTAGMRAANGG